jgi:integrase
MSRCATTWPAHLAGTRNEREAPQPGGGWLLAVPDEGGERFRVAGPVSMPDGTTKMVRKRGFLTKKDGQSWLADQQSAGRKGEYVEPSKQRVGPFGAEVIDGMRIGPQTKASYKKNWRLHMTEYPIAQVPSAQLTGQRLTAHYRVLEKSGRKDHREGEGLSARTVRYLHTIIHGVLGHAVKDGLLLRNPADAATPPTAREAKAPDMHPWDASQLAAFLGWAEGAAQNYPLWHTLAMTGMRRGEALALRWRDVDLEAATISIRRSAGMVRNAGEGAEVREGYTKSGKPRVVDLDDDAAAVLRSHRKARGSMALQLITPDSLVFGDLEGAHRNPEHVSRQFTRDVERCGQVPAIRLHDLRHSHATLLLLAREPVHVVSQRLGHASPMVTLTVYAHVMPGNQRETANTFARLVREAKGA